MSFCSFVADGEDYYDETCDTSYPELPESVTLAVITTTPKYHQESVIITPEAARNMISSTSSTKVQEDLQVEQHEDYDKMDAEDTTTGVHFLTDDEATETYERKKNELLEYIMRDDGSVVCKLCGQLLQSRTHWYRHKYKFHVNNMVNPAPLFKCKHCNVFFKSRKGYMGHISSRHSSPPAENISPVRQPVVIKHEDLDISIKEEIVEATPEVPKLKEKKKQPDGTKPADWEEQRVKEEQLVAAIIDRVRKECEAQGSAVTRRGYSRRSTVMMNTT